MFRLLLTIPAFLLSVQLVQSKEVLKSIDNQIIINLDDDYHIIQIQDDVFYAPLLAKVSTAILDTTKCYFNPFWNSTVLPIRVDIWSTKYLQELHKQLEERKVAICSSFRKGDVNLNGTMCNKNITVLPTPMTVIKLESELSHFTSLKIDVSYRRFSPRAVSFSVRIPDFTNCSHVKALFQENSFLNVIYLVATMNRQIFSNDSPVNKTLNDTIDISLTNQIIFDAVNLNEELSKALNMSTVKYVREDYIQSISSTVAVLLLRNVSMNFANAEKIRDVAYKFLCSSKESVANTMKRVNVKTEAYPDATATLLDGMSNIQYCRIPQIEWKHRYGPNGQVYQPMYNRYVPVVAEFPNVKHYFKISLRRILVPNMVRLPLTN